MTSGRKAVVLSIAIHGMFLCGIYSVGSTFAQPGKPVAIDFTLLDSQGAASENKQPETKTAVIPQPKPRNEFREKRAARKIEKTEPTRVAAASSQEPALEAAGPVPASSKPLEAQPKEAAPRATGGNGNQVSAAPARTASLGSSGTGVNKPGEQARSRYTREHYAYIKKLIEKSLSYPPRARKMGWTGRVVVCFQVLNNGHVDKIRIKDSSGHEILDNNVIDTIREVEPFPRPPEWVEISMPIVYRLY